MALLVSVVMGLSGCSGRAQGTLETPAPSSPSKTGPAAGSLTPAPSATTAFHLARSVPVRLQIAAIGVDSDLMGLGLRADGTMAVPPGGFPAGWYTGGPTPGELGPAVIAGHVDLKGPGVFYALHTLKPGDRVTVTRKDRSRPVFRVTRVSRFPKSQFPTALVYGNLDHSGLRLITCGGSFDSATGHYDDNIVAFADLVTPTS